MSLLLSSVRKNAFVNLLALAGDTVRPIRAKTVVKKYTKKNNDKNN